MPSAAAAVTTARPAERSYFRTAARMALRLGAAGFVEMLVFIGVLVLGFVYLWRSGGLEALDK